MSESGLRYVDAPTDDPRVIAFEIVGKVTEQDMKDILARIEAVVERGEKALVFEAVVDLGGVEFMAIWEKIKSMGTLWKGIERAAVLADSKLLRSFADGFADAVTPMDISAFELSQRDDAWAWLLGPPSDDEA